MLEVRHRNWCSCTFVCCAFAFLPRSFHMHDAEQKHTDYWLHVKGSSRVVRCGRWIGPRGIWCRSDLPPPAWPGWGGDRCW